MSADLIHAKPSKGFNLSRWAISHGSFTAFLLVLLLAAGGLLAARIGQKEDPDFTFRVMVVQVRLARRIRRGDAGPGGRQDRAQAAGDAASRLRPLLYARRQSPSSSSI